MSTGEAVFWMLGWFWICFFGLCVLTAMEKLLRKYF